MKDNVAQKEVAIQKVNN